MTITYESSCKIDWYSFSLLVGAKPDDERAYRAILLNNLISTGSVMYELCASESVEQGGGRRPFHTSFEHYYFTLFYNHVIDHALIEVSGSQCSRLHERGDLIDLIAQTHETCTRIDLATDINVGHENQVSDFVASGFSARFRSVSDIRSNSGHSYYIGSRKSERMCRIYQYNPPHPRSRMLRVEVELKGDRAKQIALALATNVSVGHCTEFACSPYQFLSDMWTRRTGNEELLDLNPIAGKQQSNNTLFWIHAQVVPAIHRLMREGIIPKPDPFEPDAIDWLAETFIDTFKD